MTCNNNKNDKIVTKLTNYNLNNVYDSTSVFLEFTVFNSTSKLKIMGSNCDTYKYNLIIGLFN